MNSRVIFSLVGFTMLAALAGYNYVTYNKSCAGNQLSVIPAQAQKANKITTKRDVTTTVTPNGNTVTTVKELSIIELKRHNRISVDVQCREASIQTGTCKDRVYGLGFERRLFDSPVFIGGGLDSKGGIKLSTSVEF